MNFMNKQTKVGDNILPLTRINGCYMDHSWFGSGFYENYDRGRGEYNRVRDCQINDDICKINLVEIPFEFENIEDDTQEFDYEKKEWHTVKDERDSLFYQILNKLGNHNRLKEGNILYIKHIKDAGFGMTWRKTNTRYMCSRIQKTTFYPEKIERYKYYVSVEKPEEFNSHRREGSNVRSNVQIYTDEFINLTFLSSNILKYFIESKHIGNISGNYAYAITYLQKALRFIQDRENNEYILINRYKHSDISKISGIDVILSKWKYNEGIRVITEKKAKKFAEYLNNINTDDEFANIIHEVPWKTNK